MPTDLGVHFWSSTGGGGGGGGGGTVPKARATAVSANATSATITFASAFGATPVVVATLSSTNATADMIAIQEYFVSAAGFSVQFATQIPDATYSLNWIASDVNDS